jgi:transcriptional regulator of acetoin/glycerol metabolism
MSSHLERAVKQLAAAFIEEVFGAIRATSLQEILEEVGPHRGVSRPHRRFRATSGALSLRDAEDTALRDALVASLSQHNGNVSAVANAMGQWRTQVRRWIQRFGLEVQRRPLRKSVILVPSVSIAEERARKQSLRLDAIADSLERHNGNRTVTARALGISRRTMHRWMLRLDREGYTFDPRDKMRDELVAQLTKLRGNESAVARAMGKERRTVHRWMKRFGLHRTSFRSLPGRFLTR